MRTLLLKEINHFLSSLSGYIVIGVFLVVNGLFLWVFPVDFNILDYGYAGLDGLFAIAPFVFLFLIPAIMMRTFSEEKRSGTIEFLLTKPLGDWSIILAKYIAGFLLVVFSLLPTLIYVSAVYKLGLPPGNMDMGATWGSYAGLLMLGAAFVAIGLFSSILTSNQIVAFILSVFLSGFIYAGFDIIYTLDLFGSFDLFIKTLGIADHYQSMSRGVIDTRDVLYFISLVMVFLLATRLVLQSRKW